MSEPVPLESLTDEELAFLALPGSPVVSPYLDELGLGPGDAGLAPLVRTAFRGLVARGIVDPPTPAALLAAADETPKGHRSTDPATIELAVRQDVQTVLAVRAGAPKVVMASRMTSAGHDFWYAHVVEDVALLEEVDGHGIHCFAMADLADLSELTCGALIHPEAAAGEARGPLELAGADDWPAEQVLAVLGEAYVKVDLVVRHVDDGGAALLGLYSGPRGCWIVDAGVFGAGSVPVARPVTPKELRDAIRRRVSAEAPS